MKNKYGFQTKSKYTVKELSVCLLVGQSVLQNYLYKKNKVAKLSHEYMGEELLGILGDYSKEVYLRKEETVERAKFLAKKVAEMNCMIEGVDGEEKEVEKSMNDSIATFTQAISDLIEDEDKNTEGVINDAIEIEKTFDFLSEDFMLKIINWVSMVSALIGIYKELDWLGVISLGFITCLFLLYTLRVMSNVDSGGIKKMVACLAMIGVELFWAMFHVKTFSLFDSATAIFKNETSFITACVIGGLSFAALLIQAFKNEDV